jgi:isocitrate dehydrogenase kinase/phosphatase
MIYDARVRRWGVAQLTASRLANLGAQAILRAYQCYAATFQDITRRAPARFASRDWWGMRSDATERLDLYRQIVDPTVRTIRTLLGERLDDRLTWASIKAVYSGLIADHHDWEVAETFFNSITRRIFATVGVDPIIEFVDTDFDLPPTQPRNPLYQTYSGPVSPQQLVQAIVADALPGATWADPAGDVVEAGGELGRQLEAAGLPPEDIEQVEVLRPVFYRNKGAYLVGRLRCGGRPVAFALALLNPPAGIVLDAVLTDEDDLSRVFSFAHSYFHVDVDRPHDVVAFLSSLMPRKRVAELYISLGYHKHGKTELYRDLRQRLATSREQFTFAPGQPGMVMHVFTLPGYDLVLKVIRNRFAQPKSTTRKAVMQKYQLVFRHDRAGRLVDAQEFEHLEFDRDRFSPDLLDELLASAGATVSVAGDRVIIEHAYIERRVTPLDVYLREAPPTAAQLAAVDLGHAIKDLAASNIFPGDFLLKNFGVTRHGRVVSYDYDELCLVTDCRFLDMPQPRDGVEFEELASEPWFLVRNNDVFPEEFRSFLRLPGDANQAFIRHHADLFEVRFWQNMQKHLHAGDVIDVFPYSQDRRLPNRSGGGRGRVAA